MIPTRTWAAVALVALLGCGDRAEKEADLSTVLPNLPLPPQPTLVSKSGSANTLMITLSSPAKPADVASYYHSVLTGPGWKLVKQSTDRTGATTMLAEQDGPPLWVRIRGKPDSSGTLVDLAGAVAQSSAEKPAS